MESAQVCGLVRTRVRLEGTMRWSRPRPQARGCVQIYVNIISRLTVILILLFLGGNCYKEWRKLSLLTDQGLVSCEIVILIEDCW